MSNDDVLITSAPTDTELATELRLILGRAADLMNEIRQRGWSVEASLPMQAGIYGKISGKFIAAVNITRSMTL